MDNDDDDEYQPSANRVLLRISTVTSSTPTTSSTVLTMSTANVADQEMNDAHNDNGGDFQMNNAHNDNGGDVQMNDAHNDNGGDVQMKANPFLDLTKDENSNNWSTIFVDSD